jgi:IS5 family transposase
MKQTTFGMNLNAKKTRKQIFLAQMEKVVPWAALVERIAPYYPEGKTGRPPFSLQTMLRVHFMQHTILRFRQRLEKHKLADQILSLVNELLTSKGLLLKVGTVVDATLIEAPSSTKNKDHSRDPEMHSSKKGERMYFGMKAHIGADAESGLVHTVKGTSGNVHDVIEGNSLLHGDERLVFGDAGYQGVDKRRDAKANVNWHIAMRPGKRRALNKNNPADALLEQAEKLKAGIRAKVEHPFRVIKRQFGYVKVRYRGLKKNTAQLVTLFALSNLWMVRGKLMGAQE